MPSHNIVETDGVKKRVPRGTRVMGSLAYTILKTLDFVEKHPEDPNSPKYISEARGFCKENGFKLEKVKVGSQETPAWRMTPAERAKHTNGQQNGTTQEAEAPA